MNQMSNGLKNSIKEIKAILKKASFFQDELTRIAYAPDAGCYQKTPELVIKPENEAEVSEILKILTKNKVPLCFRSAGTSLSGQSVSDSILMVNSGESWKKAEVLENGKLIKCLPGITGNRLNQLLYKFNLKFGPDPASLNSAMVGGIIANNASGMSCGTHANSYATIKSARIVFSEGEILDTADPDSRNAFRKSHPELINNLMDIRGRILAKKDLVSFIQEKYSIKNTTGYGMNSFIDYEDPIDIILHLMVGSEGTLGFISEACFETVPLLEKRASSLLYFENLEDACNAVPKLREAGVTAIELMDREALRSVENQKGIPGFIKEFHDSVTALLIDLETKDEKELDDLMKSTRKALAGFKLVRSFEVTKDIQEILEFWKVRKGVFPSVGGTRKPGTTVIIEDVAVKLEHLTNAVLDLREMLDKNGFSDAVIYGHALDGNLHFIFSQNFEDEKELLKYKNLIEVLTHLIVDKYKGSLKAEHGTGINMAPFVKYEWGEEIYEMMKEIKQSFDPFNILNPGVIINKDEEAHLKNFKKFPEIDASVDKCIECGFCEINCLSSGFTLSARQRIVVQRSLKQLENNLNTVNRKKIKAIRSSFIYAGDKTCAVDGLCAVTCPLDIDTGDLIKNIRSKEIQKRRKPGKYAGKIADNFSATKSLIRKGLGVIDFFHRVFGSGPFQTITDFFRFISFKRIPLWTKYMPRPAEKLDLKDAGLKKSSQKIVYFPSCINQTMGLARTSDRNENLMDVCVKVLQRAGYELIFPDNMKNLCCGTPWESKGFFDIADMKAAELEKELLMASNNGQYPVLIDTSPCVYRIKKFMNSQLSVYEPVEFIYEFLLDKLTFTKIQKEVAFHTTCTTEKMGVAEKFKSIANKCVSHPVFPENVGCCGFAGDKGFMQPELNDWALRELKPAVKNCNEGYSNSRTCEIGLSRLAGFDYKSIMYLVNEATMTKNKA